MHHEPAMDFLAALLTELLKVMRPALPLTISVMQLEKRKRPVASKAAPPADLPRRRADRALRNSDRQLKLVSAFRSVAAKLRALVKRPLRPQAQPKIPAPRSDLPAQVFCSRDRHKLPTRSH